MKLHITCYQMTICNWPTRPKICTMLLNSYKSSNTIGFCVSLSVWGPGCLESGPQCHHPPHHVTCVNITRCVSMVISMRLTWSFTTLYDMFIACFIETIIQPSSVIVICFYAFRIFHGQGWASWVAVISQSSLSAKLHTFSIFRYACVSSFWRI